MNRITPGTAGGSLIERAADAYGWADLGRPPPPRVLTDPPGAFAEPRVHLPPQSPVSPFVSSGVEKRGLASRGPTSLATDGEELGASSASSADRAVIDRVLLAEAGMIVPGGPVSVLAEEFRLVKRQLLLTARRLAGDPARARTILICSARPDEGKTFCAINLALSLAAERDTEVLLIDGDFAKRDLLPRLGLANRRGLLDLLADPSLDPEALVTPTDVPQLSLLDAGTRTIGDTELLASDRTSVVLARLLAADPRRILLFDSPPVLAASPAAVFALHAGQAMLVVRADVTTETEIREAVALLDGCERIQLLLNQVRHQTSDYRFGDYYSPQEDSK